MEKQTGPKGFLVVLPGEIIEIPQDSDKSWLTLFYSLPRELAEKWKPACELPRCPYEVLRTDRYDHIVCDDMFKLLVWDCYAWSAWQFFQVKDRKRNYRDIPGNWNQYAGYFPLWRLSYSIIPYIRMKFEQNGLGFQNLYNIPQGVEVPWLTYQQFSNLIGNVTDMVIAEQNWQPMIDAIWENRTVEDYETTGSIVKTDFMRKWHHNRSGKSISLDEMMENEDGDIFEVADPRGEFEQKVISEMQIAAFAVCAYFGIETGENSFGYIATWSKGKKLPELKASLETINRTASGLITDIDRNYKMLMKERGLDKEPESLAAEPVQEIAVQKPEPVSAPDNGCVPDPAISVESMNAYGYTDADMLPLTKERALELMERDVTVYMLHPDNTEAMAFDADEIRSFDGIFGVEVSEWETVKDCFVPRDYEKAFLDNPSDSFAIYQLRDNDDTARLHYMNSEYLEKKGLTVQKENYAAVYAGNLDRRDDTQDKLNELYEIFNIRRPEDFRGHSLSVSDIVALKQNGVVSCHYVDSWGFKELPGFLKQENYLENAEMAMEDDYGMIDGIINNGPRKTVAELEEQSKTGTPISLLELAQAVQRESEEKRREQQPVRREKSGEKPSILAKLKAPSVADTKSVKSAPKRSAEREL